MDIVIKPYSAFPCATKVFKINGIDADIEDFGCMNDEDALNAEPYCCAKMQFIAESDYETKKRAMLKYMITEAEFYEIQSKLFCKMNVGCCRCCE